MVTPPTVFKKQPLSSKNQFEAYPTGTSHDPVSWLRVVFTFRSWRSHRPLKPRGRNGETVPSHVFFCCCGFDGGGLLGRLCFFLTFREGCDVFFHVGVIFEFAIFGKMFILFILTQLLIFTLPRISNQRIFKKNRR